MGGEPPVTVQAGQIILLPRNDPHVLASGPKLRPVPADGLIQPGVDGGLSRIQHGGGGERTSILCGYLGADAAGLPIIQLLPSVMTIGVEEGLAGWIESSLRFAAQQLSSGRAEPGLLARLAELLFIEAVRKYLGSLPEGADRWISGLKDPAIGRALALMHVSMTQRWTTEGLAREVGMSRSAFADRFVAVMGEPPMRYLAEWRMQVASQRLRLSREPVARIAYETGYESEAAFNRAFKRIFDMPPDAWRKKQSGGLRSA